MAPEAIIAAAAEFVDIRGLRDLTMAALARSMDVPVTSIHWHFRTREDLLDTLAERLTADVYGALPPLVSDRPWEEEFITYSVALRHELLKRPSFLELALDRSRLLARPAVKRLINQRLEGEVAALAHLGVSPVDAYRLFNVCSVYVRGFVIFELAAKRQYHRDSGPPLDFTLPDSQMFPFLSQVDLLAVTWDDADTQFRLGLEILVAGIKTTVEGKR
jgi:AcrR family transcriptional regulator